MFNIFVNPPVTAYAVLPRPCTGRARNLSKFADCTVLRKIFLKIYSQRRKL